MAESSTNTDSASQPPLVWRWQGQDVEIGLTRMGQGRLVLLLPAPSSISTRTEMAALAAQLSGEFETLAIDLPGFGTAPKPKIAWTPEAYLHFVADMLQRFRPYATVAAGHAASYALQCAADAPGSAGRLALVAPSWRGPLPTVLNDRPAWLSRVAGLAEFPVRGALLYRVNVNPAMIRMMGRGHVYADKHWLEGKRLDAKLGVTNATGARHASVRFVCGELDLLRSREEWIGLARKLEDDVLVIYGAETPRRTRAEIDALSVLPRVRSIAIPKAKLAVHEEFADATAAALLPFLQGPAHAAAASAA
jgi:pimeloyl-ACP methyl ester carboxylesterase